MILGISNHYCLLRTLPQFELEMRESSNWQSKWSRREPFGENIGENIGHMISTGNKLDFDISRRNLIMNKMQSNLSMLGPSMINRIDYEIGGGNIIRVDEVQ